MEPKELNVFEERRWKDLWSDGHRSIYDPFDLSRALGAKENLEYSESITLQKKRK